MLDKLKRLFIVEEENSSKKSPKTPSPKAASSSSPSATPSAEKPLAVDARPQERFIEILLEAMDRNNLEGFDYLEYKQALQNLATMPMDEATRYKSAFAGAHAMGVTTDRLLQSAAHYIKVLEGEENKFEKALVNQRQKQVENKQAEYGQLAKLLEEKQRQIQQIQEEMQAHEKRRTNLKGEIEQAARKVDETQAQFIASYNQLVRQIQKDIERMKQHLS